MTSTSLSPLRRVVTTHGQQGLAVVDSDMLLEPEGMPMVPGARATSIWVTTDGLPVNDNNNQYDQPNSVSSKRLKRRYYSDDGAKRPIDDPGNFGLVHPSGTNVRSTELDPGAMTPMHRTSSLDYNILVSGTLILITEDGVETLLQNPGDTVIQKGTMHAWKNPSDSLPTRWISVLVAAQPAIVNGESLKPDFILGDAHK